MRGRYVCFDRSRLRIQPLAARVHDLNLSQCLQPGDSPIPYSHPGLPRLAHHMLAARESGAARIFMMGAHVIKSGASRIVIDLMERGLVDHVAVNGACVIHDFELATHGATSESVARYIRAGEFGLWRETGELNEWIAQAGALGIGLGENVGRRLLDHGCPHLEASILAAGYRLGIPVTVHVGIGYDIIHQHPNCDGAALGAASYTDFLIFAASVERLENGSVVNFGSAVMGPEVYLKALSMARNVARQQGRSIRQFTVAVFDLHPEPGEIHAELPKTAAGYYFRPHKTMLIRTVAGGGESFYFCGEHRATLPALRRALLERS